MSDAAARWLHSRMALGREAENAGKSNNNDRGCCSPALPCVQLDETLPLFCALRGGGWMKWQLGCHSSLPLISFAAYPDLPHMDAWNGGLTRHSSSLMISLPPFSPTIFGWMKGRIGCHSSLLRKHVPNSVSSPKRTPMFECPMVWRNFENRLQKAHVQKKSDYGYTIIPLHNIQNLHFDIE